MLLWVPVISPANEPEKFVVLPVVVAKSELVAFPDKLPTNVVAVIVFAAKLPESSLATIVFIPVALFAVVAVFDIFPAVVIVCNLLSLIVFNGMSVFASKEFVNFPLESL